MPTAQALRRLIAVIPYSLPRSLYGSIRQTQRETAECVWVNDAAGSRTGPTETSSAAIPAERAKANADFVEIVCAVAASNSTYGPTGARVRSAQSSRYSLLIQILWSSA